VILNWAYDSWGNLTDVGADGNTAQVRQQFDYENVEGQTNLYPTTITTAPGTSAQRAEVLDWDLGTGLLESRYDQDNG